MGETKTKKKQINAENVVSSILYFVAMLSILAFLWQALISV